MLLKILLGVVIICVATFVILILFIQKNAFIDNAEKSDVIVVLGAKTSGKKEKNLCLTARIQHGIDLFKEGMAKKLLLSGGKTKEDSRNEADTMEQMAVSKGISLNDVVLDDSSTSTYENLRNTQKIMQKNNLVSVIIVTDAYHSVRASLVAQKLGMNYSLSPAKESPCSLTINGKLPLLFTEILALIVYKVIGKI